MEGGVDPSQQEGHDVVEIPSGGSVRELFEGEGGGIVSPRSEEGDHLSQGGLEVRFVFDVAGIDGRKVVGARKDAERVSRGQGRATSFGGTDGREVGACHAFSRGGRSVAGGVVGLGSSVGMGAVVLSVRRGGHARNHALSGFGRWTGVRGGVVGLGGFGRRHGRLDMHRREGLTSMVGRHGWRSVGWR